MTPEFLLLSTAVGLGALHTAIGVDHTLPFVVLSKARSWSMKKTLAVTFACGLGHVLSSIAVGAAGFLLGVATLRLEAFEALRGNWAAWLLIAFGTVYAFVGVFRLLRGSRHVHVHVHPDGTVHSHSHAHGSADGRVIHQHGHVKAIDGFSRGRLVPTLILIFVVGPCEALVPLMFAPAASGHVLMPWLIALCFSLSTLATMLLIVGLGVSALDRSSFFKNRFAALERHMNWAAGVIIALSGVAIEVLGV